MRHFKTYILLLLLASPVIISAQLSDTLFLRYADDYDINDNPIYVTDTMTFASPLARQILVGTTVLPNALRMWTAEERGFYLYKVEALPCSGGEELPDFGNDKITDIRMTDSTLEVDVTIYDNCCFNFLCTASVDSTNTMHIEYIGYGALCACSCCFGLTYVFSCNDYFKDQEHVETIMIGEYEASRRKFVPYK